MRNVSLQQKHSKAETFIAITTQITALIKGNCSYAVEYNSNCVVYYIPDK